MATRWNFKGAKNLERMFGGDRNLRELMLLIGALYMGDMHARYVRASRTPGNPWKDLADSTKRRRRKGTGEGVVSFAILRDLGLLLNALAPRGIRHGPGGQLRMITRTTVRAGYSQSARHPDTDFTYAELANVHQQGNSKLPARPIFVEPSPEASERMRRVIRQTIERVGDMGRKRRRR